ncbi:hypothetical protein [Nonomuraea sp. NPDC049695]
MPRLQAILAKIDTMVVAMEADPHHDEFVYVPFNDVEAAVLHDRGHERKP